MSATCTRFLQRRDRVAFILHPLQKRQDVELERIADIVDWRMVRGSGGHAEMRVVISTLLKFAGMEWPTEVTLINREDMLFRMLLGRTALRDSVQFNCHRSYLSGKSQKSVYNTIVFYKIITGGKEDEDYYTF